MLFFNNFSLKFLIKAVRKNIMEDENSRLYTYFNLLKNKLIAIGNVFNSSLPYNTYDLYFKRM